MTPDQVPRCDPSLQVLTIDGEVVLYDGEQLRFLDGSAAAVWTRIDGVTRLADLAAALAEQFPNQRLQADGDVHAFVNQLETLGLVTAGEVAAGGAYRKPADVGYARDDGSVLLVHLADGRRRALSATATRIWDLVLLGIGVEDIIMTLQNEYPDTPSSLPSEVRQLLAELVDARFLQVGR